MKPLDLTAPAHIKIELKGSSSPDDLDYGGVLNLLGVMPSYERPCSLHPDHTIGGEVSVPS